MAWSKFDPHAPPEPVDPLQPATPAAGRRARALKWASLITLGMTVLGYALIGYWLFLDR